MMIRVKTIENAWKLANKMFPADYIKDEEGSERAGYPVYRATTARYHGYYICDFGYRLELNLGSKVESIYIDATEPEELERVEVEVSTTDGLYTRKYESYREFEFDYNLWFAWMSVKGHYENLFKKAVDMLKQVGEHGMAMEIVANGMIYKFTYYRFNGFDRWMNKIEEV